MWTRHLLAALLATLTACSGEGPGTSAETSSLVCSAEGCTCKADATCDEGLWCVQQTCTPTGDGSESGSPSTGDGTSSDADGSESSSAGPASTSGADESTGPETTAPTSTTGETSETSAESSSTGDAPACGDGELNPGEECDDGNFENDDGCNGICELERWEHVGVAHDVLVDKLFGWELCWSGDYGAGDLVSDVTDACDGDHLMMACRMKGSDTLTVAAHAPREDVLWPIAYGEGERHAANGVNWYWAPDWNIEGFSPGDDPSGCDPNGDGIQPDHVCWLNADDEPLTFQVGARCGLNDINSDEAALWERVMFHSAR